MSLYTRLSMFPRMNGSTADTRTQNPSLSLWVMQSISLHMRQIKRATLDTQPCPSSRSLRIASLPGWREGFDIPGQEMRGGKAELQKRSSGAFFSTFLSFLELQL